MEEVRRMKLSIGGNWYIARLIEKIGFNLSGSRYKDGMMAQVFVEENDCYADLFRCERADQFTEDKVAMAIEAFYRAYNEED